MRLRMIVAVAIVALLETGCVTSADVPTTTVGHASLRLASGSPAGTARLLRDGGGLSLEITVVGMATRQTAYYLHAVGRCEAPGFETAGGLLMPGGVRQGQRAKGKDHPGDRPDRPMGEVTTSLRQVVPGGGASLASIFDADGTAVIVHATAIEESHAGAAERSTRRIACGVLRRR